MRYVPYDRQITDEVLRDLKLKSFDDLFSTIPSSVCFDAIPHIIDAKSERQIYAHLSKLAAQNITSEPSTGWLNFLGAGSYHHYIPAAVDALVSRGEYLTSYTPYQAEISQGNLQAGFEFQSLIANLVGMDVANASMYDGANALLEAVLMAKRVHGVKTGGNKVLISAALHPQYREVLATYASGLFEIQEVPWDPKTGVADFSKVGNYQEVFAVALQYPNFFGCLEDLAALQKICKQHNLVSIVCNTEPLAFAALKPPGAYGIDIFAGEGQSLGNPVNYGGPHLGMLATMKAHLRNLPGRLVGKTVDAEGKEGYVLTLTTREQHIRREKATSNICTNQFLLALRSTIYLAMLGETGLRGLAFENAKLISYLQKLVGKSKQLKLKFSQPVFNECVIDLGANVDKVLTSLEKSKVIGGLNLQTAMRKTVGTQLDQCLLVNVNEMHSTKDLEQFVAALEAVL
jgi:glycine dehydrogenase subunit 1